MIQAVEISYVRDDCGVNREDGKSNGSAYGRFVMFSGGEEINCGMVEVVKYSILT